MDHNDQIEIFVPIDHVADPGSSKVHLPAAAEE